jgi:hypothetical protein
MSIQQDKRVVKPSKMSERYARWFETRVPSTSPMFRYMLMFIFSIPMSFLALYFYMSAVNPAIVMIIVTGLGIIVYLFYLVILRIRFRSTISDQQFSQILSQAENRVGTRRNVQIWPQRSSNAYIAPTFNVLFDAILISEPMIDLIDKMPESGEVLLGYHLLRVPDYRNVLDLVLGTLPFLFISSLLTFILTRGVTDWYILIILLLNYSIMFFVPVLLVLALKAATWSHDSAFERTTGIYGMHPQVAKDEVISSQKLDEEAARATIWVVREWERRKRSGRRSSITVLVAAIILLFEYFFFAIVGFPFYPPFFYVMSLLVFLPPLIVGFAVYMVLGRWDKKCMAEMYYTTKAADEPIWVD